MMILLHCTDMNRVFLNPRRVQLVGNGTILLNDGSVLDFVAPHGTPTRLLSQDIAEDVADFLSGNGGKPWADTANYAHGIGWRAGPAYAVASVRLTYART